MQAVARVTPVWHGVEDPNLFSTAEYSGGYDDVSLTIPAGAGIQLQLNAANRDPRRWDDPYDLRLDRPDPRPPRRRRSPPCLSGPPVSRASTARSASA